MKQKRQDTNSYTSLENSNSKTSQNKESEKLFLLKILQQISQRLKTEHGLINNQIIESSTEEQQIMIPVSIFSFDLCPSEALTKYLKEEHDLNYHEISVLTNRNERGVWANYQRAIKKKSTKFEISDSIFVPISIFQNNKFSILECLISYLKEVSHLKNSKIAKLLNKNSSNIWTIYNRTKVKEVKKNE